MRNFLRTLKHSWPYRYRLVGSVVCAFFVAILWSLNLSAIYPILNILSTDKNLQQWVDEEIDTAKKQVEDPQRASELKDRRSDLQKIQNEPASPGQEDRERKATRAIAKLEGDQSSAGNALYRYQLLKNLLIRHLPTDKFETFVWIVAAVIVGVALKGVFEFCQEALVGSATNRTLFDLRNRFFRRAIQQDVRQLAGTGTAEITARFTNDLEQLGLGVKVLYGRMVVEPLKMIGCLVVATYISWQLTLLFAVLIPAAGIVLMRVSKMMRRAAKKVLERMSALYKILRETFDGVRAVKAFTREPYERRRFRRASEEYYRKAMRVIYIDSFADPMIELLGVAAVSAALAAGTYLVVTKHTHILGLRMTAYPLEFATLLQLYAFLAAIADPVRKLSSVYTKLQTGEAAANRVFDLFDRMPEVRSNPGGSRVFAVEKGIEFHDVCFSYDPTAERPTLSHVDLTVRPGETIAIVGPNGCGKTTLLGLLPRFYDPTHGAILIDGVNIRTAHLRTLRKMIGIVTQDTQLFDDTVLANIAYGRKRASKEEVIEAAKRAHAHAFIETFPEGYDKVIGEKGERLSGGQRQRIALARAILRDPRILILDEFTSQVDAESEVEIHAALKAFVKPRPPAPDAATPAETPDRPAGAGEAGGTGRTTFLITHRLHSIPELADRVVVMDAGRIVDVGTHAELLARCGLYRRLHQSAQYQKVA